MVAGDGGNGGSGSGGTGDGDADGDKTNKDKFEKENEWKQKEEALNRISYAKGEKHYIDYTKWMQEIEVEYNRQKLEHTDLSENERLSIEAAYYEAVKKQTEQAAKTTIEEEEALYNEVMAVQKQRYIDGNISYAVYEETIEQLEIRHLNTMVSLYEKGSKEQLQAQRSLQDKLLANQRKHQKEYEEATMVILINKKRAVLKKGTSFDFISENHYFTGADSYTLSITFPIKGCAENIAIFGHIYRKDFNFDTELLDCEIHDQDFHKYGSVSIVSVSDSEVKTQFLEGRSASNYHSSFDDIYINELSMPSLHDQAHWGASHYLRPYAEQKRDGNYLGYVCPLWVNNTSGNIQNPMGAYGSYYYYKGGDPSYDPPIVGFPFLIEVIRQVLSRSGYQCDLSAIEKQRSTAEG